MDQVEHAFERISLRDDILNESFVDRLNTLEVLDTLMSAVQAGACPRKAVIASGALESLNTALPGWSSFDDGVFIDELARLYASELVVAEEGLFDWFSRVGDRFSHFFASYEKKQKRIEKLIKMTPEEVTKLESYAPPYKVVLASDFDKASKALTSGCTSLAKNHDAFVSAWKILGKIFKSLRGKETEAAVQLRLLNEESEKIMSELVKSSDALLGIVTVSGGGRTYKELGYTGAEFGKQATWFVKFAANDLKKSAQIYDKSRTTAMQSDYDTYYNGVKIAEVRDAYGKFSKTAKKLFQVSGAIMENIDLLENNLYRAASRL